MIDETDCVNQTRVDMEWIGQISAPKPGHVGRIVILEKPDRWGLRDEDSDEAEARAEFIHNYIQHDRYGVVLGIGDEEFVPILTVIRKRDKTRDIRVRLDSRQKKQGFSKFWLSSGKSVEDGDSDAFASNDFLESLPEFNKTRYATDKTKKELKKLCVEYTSECLPVESRENLKRKILVVYDRWCSLREASQRRQQVKAEKSLEEFGNMASSEAA